jgi:hypothetical protein
MGLYLNGEDVTWWTTEADLVAGWVKGYAHHVTPDGKRLIGLPGEQWKRGGPSEIVRNGKVELRPKGDGLTLTRTAIVSGLEPQPDDPPLVIRPMIRTHWTNVAEHQPDGTYRTRWRLHGVDERGRETLIDSFLSEAP